MRFFNREQLYKQVWSTPLTKLALQYNMSNYKLKSYCDKLNIPTPQAGYWMKKAVNKEGKTPKLPIFTDFIISKMPINKTIIISTQPVKNEVKIKINKTLSNPHYLIQKTMKNLISKYGPDNYGMYTTGNGVDIRISKESMKRGLKIYDSVQKWFEKNNYKVENTDSGSTYIIVNDTKVQIRLEEKSKQTGKTTDRWGYSQIEYTPTGNLSLIIKEYLNGVQKQWSDNNKKTLEELVPDFINGVIVASKVLKQEAVEREEWHRKWEEEKRLKEQQKLNEELERQKIHELELEASNYHKSIQIKEYIDAVKNNHLQQNIRPTKEFDEWYNWALNHINNLRPKIK
jgi:hypothetical protein